MEYRELGRTKLKVSVVGFGALHLQNISLDESLEVIDKAMSFGINFIDTAGTYGDSERKIGKAITGERNKWYLATKTLERDREGALNDVKLSLRNLNVNYIDLMQLHSVSDKYAYDHVMSPNGALSALKKARKKGWVHHLGVSCHRDLNVMKSLVESEEFDTIMLVYNPIDQENVKEIIDLAYEREMGIIAMKPLCGGRLVWPEPIIGKKNKLALDCLRWILSNKKISTVIPGMRNIEEVVENACAGQMKFGLKTSEQSKIFDLLGELVSKFGVVFNYKQLCLRCHYCQPCPQGIDIVEVLRALDILRAFPKNLRDEGKEIFKSLKVKPDKCNGCLDCVGKCPASLPIPDLLKEATKEFAFLD